MNDMVANKRLIGVSVLVVAGTITLAEIQRHQRLPGADQWIGLALAYFVISVLADLKVPIAGGFAMLVMVAALLTRGDEALAFAMNTQDRERRKRIRTERQTRRARRSGRRSARGEQLEPLGARDATMRRSESLSLT